MSHKGKIQVTIMFNAGPEQVAEDLDPDQVVVAAGSTGTP